MEKYFLTLKCVTIVVLFFIGTCIIPSASSESTIEKNIITVDDEPGDADFTSIMEAVDYSSPGDTIKVYSGTYFEQGIRILNDNITLQGISYELGGGGDTGKPFIKGDGTSIGIHVQASHVIVSNFTIENPWAYGLESYSCIMFGLSTVPFNEVIERNNITIEDCIISNTPLGIKVGDVGKNIRIINNKISNCTYGISTVSITHRFWTTLNITGNVITDCHIVGLRLDDNRQNMSGNKIRRCKTGIDLYPPGGNNIVYGNDFESCTAGIISRYGGNTIKNNNFKNSSLIGCWFHRSYTIYLSGWGLYHYLNQKDTWEGNYWGNLPVIGSKKILGKLTIGRYILGYPFYITIPWIDHDWNPANESYEIP